MTDNFDSIQDQILKARKKFIAMAVTYFLGVFNDNFFKQVIMLLALTFGKNQIQSWAAVVFTLPYLLLAAPSGWLADKYSKRSVIIGAKWLELAAMVCGALGLVYFNGNADLISLNWLLILAMLGIMGLQSSIFSPALNGSIPELYPACYIQKANGIVKLVTTFAILSGIALAGIVLDFGVNDKVGKVVQKITEEDSDLKKISENRELFPKIIDSLREINDGPSTKLSSPSILVKQGDAGMTVSIVEEKDLPTDRVNMTIMNHQQCSIILSSIKKANADNLKKVALTILIVAFLGVLISYGSPKRKGAGTSERFPWTGPIDSIRDLWHIRKDLLLFVTIGACTFFWFMGMLQVFLINKLGLSQFNWSKTATSMLLVGQMLGVAAGALLASRFSKGERWYSILQPALLLMAVFYGLMGTISFFPTSSQYTLTMIFLVFAGLGGGLYLIPLESFIQIRPDADKKGKVIAAANFSALTGTLIAGPFDLMLNHYKINPTSGFLIMGVLSVITMAVLFFSIILVEVRENRVYKGGKSMLDRFLVLLGKILLSTRYRLKIKGIENIATRGNQKIIFLPNHMALVDPAIIGTVLFNDFAPRSIGEASNLANPLVNWITKRIGVRTIPDMTLGGANAKAELDKVMEETIHGINAGENLLIYPSGHIKNTIEEIIGARSGVSLILEGVKDARVVLVRQNGLWGSSFSFGADGKRPDLIRSFKHGIKCILLNLFFFVPKREVQIEFVEPEDFPFGKDKLIINKYLEDFFNTDPWPNTFVPYHFLSSDRKRLLEEPRVNSIEGSIDSVPEATRTIVLDYLKELIGVTDISPEQRLAGDLGMDSLSIVEVLSWLEKEFGFPQADTESYQTVGDLLLGAVGQGVSGIEIALKPVSGKWFSYDHDASEIEIPDGSNIAEVFLQQAARSPGKVVFADQTTGEKTYRDVITGILALKPSIEKLSGDNLGLMFPASVGANIFYLATLFSGKTPVMVNWTTGIKNIIFSLNNVEVNHVITSRLLVSKLQAQGINLDEISEKFVYTEDLGKTISKGQKIVSFLKSYMSWKSLRQSRIREHAVILFTSGSESNPKSVPLTHDNVLSNIRDVTKLVKMLNNDKLLGMLPPFHSFGLCTTSILAFCSGMQTVFHPNPTEGKNLLRLIEAYKVTLLLGTPTFLQGILKSASGDQLSQLRFTITGAEKCPESVYDLVEKLCPECRVLEGYGLTECSPIVSANTPENAVRGSIGIMMPSLEYAIVNPETFNRVPKGSNGILLVRGPSIFHGYMNHSGNSPFIKFEENSWFNTGDLVFEGDNKIITFAGRMKRFIKLGGEMVSLPAIENALLPHFTTPEDDGPVLAVESANAETNPEIILFITVDTDRAVVNSYIRDAGLSPIHNVRIIRKVDCIPVLGTGKTDYRSLKKLL